MPGRRGGRSQVWRLRGLPRPPGQRRWLPGAPGALTAAEAKKHKQQVKADRKRVQKKFFNDHDIEAPPAEDIADNDAGLPAPALSEQGRFVELWAKFGSWGVCKGCRSLQPRRLEPIDCRRVAKPETAPRACKACQNGKVVIPKFEEIPLPLRELSKEVVQALRPLDIDVGPYRRADYGYRRGGGAAGPPRRELAGLETLHHAHVFTELERGLYTGMNKRSGADGGDAWKTHLLGPTDNGPETSQAFFFRLEYQDGKRKAATQAYHGSGRVHCHSLNYLREPKRAKLEEKIRATEPSEEEAALRGYVLGRPRKIYAGMRLHLTRNVNKQLDFVNGMEATVRSLDLASGCLRVTTATGKDLA